MWDEVEAVQTLSVDGSIMFEIAKIIHTVLGIYLSIQCLHLCVNRFSYHCIASVTYFD